MEATGTPGPLIGRPVIKNGYIGVPAHLDMRPVTRYAERAAWTKTKAASLSAYTFMCADTPPKLNCTDVADGAAERKLRGHIDSPTIGAPLAVPQPTKEEIMNINWVDATLRFDPNSPDPFATHGIPLPVYGNYGGPNWSAGQIGGTATIPANPPPVDQLDALFYAHDLVYQSSNLPSVRIPADIQLVLQMQALTYTDPGASNYDPEAGLYEGLATLGTLGQLAAFGVHLPNEQVLVQEGVRNFEAGLAAVPGEAKSLHGALHVFEQKFLDLLATSSAPSNGSPAAPLGLLGQHVASSFPTPLGGGASNPLTGVVHAATSQPLLAHPHA